MEKSNLTKDDLRRDAEAKLSKQKTAATPATEADISHVVHELQVHQIELEMQNEELRRAQAELNTERARYFDLYDLAPVGYVTLSETGLILEANLAAAALLGQARGALVKQALTRFILLDDQDIYYLHRKKLFETGTPQACELRMLKTDGSKLWVHLEATAAQDKGGVPVCRVALSDISEKKRAEEELKDSEIKYRSLIEASSDAIFCVDEKGQYKFTNHVFASTFEKNPDYFIGKTFWDVYPKEHADYRFEATTRVFQTGESESLEFQVPLPDKILYFWATANPIKDETGKVILALTHATDITARKQAEEKVVAANRQIQTILESITDAFFSLDNDMVITYFNPAAEKALGRRQAEVIGHNLFDAFPEARGSIFDEKYSLAIKKKIQLSFETYFGIAPYENWYDVNVYPHPEGISVYFHVITARKLAEDTLQKNEANLSALISNSNDRIWAVDTNYRLIIGNSQFLEGIQASLKRTIRNGENVLLEEIPQNLRDLWRSYYDRALSGEIFSVESKMEFVEKPCYTEFSFHPIQNLDGGISGVVVSGRDATKRKQAEEALSNSEERFRKAFTISPDSININRLQDGMYVAINNSFTQIMGYTSKECIGKTSSELNIWDRLEDRQTLVDGLIKHGEVANLEARFRTRNGDIKYGLMSASVLELDGVKHILNITRDITEHKRAEDEILEKSKELEALFTISSHLRTAQTAKDMLPVVLEQISKAINADANAVVLLDPDRTHFTYAIGDGLFASNTGVQFDVDNSISGRVLQTRQPYVTLDFANDPLRSRSIPNSEGVGSMAVVPLQSETELIGTLQCARAKDSRSGAFTSAEVQLLVSIGEMVGNALRRARLHDDALSRLQRVQGLRSIDSFINANMDIKVTLNLLVSQSLSLMNVDAAIILLYDQNLHALEYASAQGFHYEEIEKARVELDNGYSGRAILERRIISTSDPSNIQDPVYKEMMQKERFVGCWITPMIAKGKVLGVLELYNRAPLHPNQEWLDFLEALGAQAAIAIDNAHLFRDLQTSNLELILAYDATIQGWSQALDLKDKETEGHTIRVTETTIGIAKLSGLSEDKIIHIRRGALLHDIGKMGIPDRILHKTGKLTQKEWALIRQHPQFAYDMLRPIEFLRPALDIPYYHHEKWDGTGYPHGLRDSQIPYAARLFAVVDVWDALTSDRIYRKAWPKTKAFAYIREQSGKHFDPQAVDLFLKYTETNGRA